jgi:hypothetical protein
MVLVRTSVPEIVLLYVVAHTINYNINRRNYYDTEKFINIVLGSLLLYKVLC